MEMTDALKDHVEKSLQKVRDHFDRVIDANVVLSVERHRHIADVTLHANGIRIHGKESSPDMYASMDAVAAKIDKQVQKYKDRINRFQQRKVRGLGQYEHHIIEMPEGVAVAPPIEEEVETAGPSHRVVHREKLAMKPMSVDEAVMQLELVHDQFLVFSNADTQRVNVIYGRDDGTFGLIEPQF
jgi:putative sigma-54 modulation protein